MSCDYTGRNPVLRGRLDWVGQGQTRLLHRQAGVLALRNSLLQSFEECRDKDLPKGLLYRAEYFPYPWVHPLHKSPLLLEGLLQSCIGRLWVLMGNPCQYVH